ncbi:hypothetical protein [Reinekea sp. G2M2-21]|uniref:hypothetical protein n=1 Tax=Reinekea sp. G2M2-21 TaxID=2788942 RepID=UPI0018ABCBC7|nr:hypothetical protein [Reinekea sp. G2M2-21]
MTAVKDNVIRLYDVKPEMALEHLKRSTGLAFDDLPQSLADMVDVSVVDDDMLPPILTDIVDMPVYSKA